LCEGGLGFHAGKKKCALGLSNSGNKKRLGGERKAKRSERGVGCRKKNIQRTTSSGSKKKQILGGESSREGFVKDNKENESKRFCMKQGLLKRGTIANARNRKKKRKEKHKENPGEAIF